MKTPSQMDIDFAALRTLCMVLDFGSFSRTAEALEVNQSAVSYTIEKLRRIFADPLFFRQGGQLIATERCQQIYDAAMMMLDNLDTIISPARFDPATSTDRIVLACNFYERQLLLPALMRSLRKAAPNMRLEMINSTSQGAAHLKRGEADLLLGPLKPEGTGFHSQSLYRERYVCIMDPENPLAQQPLTMQDYVNANHAVVLYGGGWRSPYLRELDARGETLNQVLTLPSPAGLNRILRGTDMISTVALGMAKVFGRDLKVVDCPLTSGFDLALAWTTRTHASPRHVWFRGLLIAEIENLVGQGQS